MAVMIDTSRAPRTPEELTGLVQAVLGALPADELDWVEWKAGMDLADKPVQGTIARHILGMANRPPTDARRHAEGCGYLLIGAEPGNPCGVTAVDPAQLSQGIQPYLGSEGPAWSPQYVQEAGVTVLVIVVEPPKEGDHIFTLEKEFPVTTPAGGAKSYLAGTIFIRQPGRTEVAAPGDIRALEQRYAAPARAAEEHARRLLEIEEARHNAEELDRRRRWLTDVAKMVASVQFKVTPFGDSPEYFRCPEQLELQAILAGMSATDLEAELPAVKALAGAGQGMEVFAAAARANIEIQAAMRNLTLRAS
jgi:hypothetical protein